MSKKKAPKGAFHNPAGGFFFQKKRVILGNVKHSGDEKDISLNKSGPDDSIYFDVNSLFGNNKNVNMSGVNSGSLLGLTATTLKTKYVNTSAVFGSLLRSSNFNMDNNEVVLPSHFLIFLDKK